jgi:hypothetical protein
VEKKFYKIYLLATILKTIRLIERVKMETDLLILRILFKGEEFKDS